MINLVQFKFHSVCVKQDGVASGWRVGDSMMYEHPNKLCNSVRVLH